MNFQQQVARVGELLENYRQESSAGQVPVVRMTKMTELISGLEIDKYLAEGMASDELSGFVEHYLTATTRLHHPGYLAHQVAVPHPSGAIAALIDGYINNPMAIYEMGPAAAAIECVVINWLLAKVGWVPGPLSADEPCPSDYAAGVLTHGGSLANLTALIAARSHANPDVWNTGNTQDMAILAPENSHYSISRAAGILGIGANAIYKLQVDRHGVVNPAVLEDCYQLAIADGRKPFALVANACSTALGLYDPLQEIGEFCRANKIWFHVDAAHGASALITEKYKHYLSGLVLADSMIWDAHKMLRVPPLCAAVLVRDHKKLDSAFQQQASYLFHDKDQPGVDLIGRTIECTKTSLSLKLFMVIASMGDKGLCDYVEGVNDLCLKAYQLITEQPDFSCVVKPQSNILCFAYQDWNEKHLKLRDELLATGDFHLSTSQINDRWYLRMVFMNESTALATVKTLLDKIRQSKL